MLTVHFNPDDEESATQAVKHLNAQGAEFDVLMDEDVPKGRIYIYHGSSFITRAGW